jgi:hypothetical protein
MFDVSLVVDLVLAPSDAAAVIHYATRREAERALAALSKSGVTIYSCCCFAIVFKRCFLCFIDVWSSEMVVVDTYIVDNYTKVCSTLL